MRPKDPVTILLATYNGGEFLPEQLASIRDQTIDHWKLLVRDDGSSDGTRSALADAATDDSRIELIEDQKGSLGAAGNFGALMSEGRRRGAERIMFADQDDVWSPTKIERELAHLRRSEATHGSETPILVHSDLRVVDRGLRTLHESFMAHQHISHTPRNPLGTLLVQNFVTGSTCLFNRSLLDIATPAPEEMVMHDWWLAVCAGATGRLEFLPDPTVSYRQHDGNEIGATGFWRSLDPRRRTWRLVSSEGTAAFVRTVRQSHCLRDRLRDRYRPEWRDALKLVDDYCDCLESPGNRLRRVLRVRRLGVRRQDPVRSLLLMLRILLMPRFESVGVSKG